MNNAQTSGAFIAGQRLLQSVNGENIVLAGTTLLCLPADLITENRLWEPGGASQLLNITVSILKQDLANPPATNTLATFRGLALRTTAISDADTFWSIQLIEESV